jgi:hypothetical protein
VWLEYLATHPSRTLAIRHDFAGIFDPSPADIASYWGGTARGLFVHGPWLLLLALLGSGVFRRRLRSRGLLVLGSFLVATLPVAVMVWDADALELYRHAVVLCVVAQLVCLVVTLLSAEALAERIPPVYWSRLKAATSIPK